MDRVYTIKITQAGENIRLVTEIEPPYGPEEEGLPATISDHLYTTACAAIVAYVNEHRVGSASGEAFSQN